MEKYVHLKGRLLEILNCVEKSEITADVGCDHGRLSVALLQSGRAKRIYASDISEPSLKKTRLLRDKCSLEDAMDIRSADGLSGIAKQPDTIIIAGMGGRLIAEILERGESIAQNASLIIMQPMRGISELRCFLEEKLYKITTEKLCKESGRMYQIICAKYAGERCEQKCVPAGFYEFGDAMLSDPLLPEYLMRLKNELNKAISEAKNGSNLLAMRELERIYGMLCEIRA